MKICSKCLINASFLLFVNNYLVGKMFKNNPSYLIMNDLALFSNTSLIATSFLVLLHVLVIGQVEFLLV